MTQIEFSKLRIGDKPAGYYSDCLYACMDEVRCGFLSEGQYVRDVADIVLARAQLYLCGIELTSAEEFLSPYNAIAEVRCQLDRGAQ